MSYNAIKGQSFILMQPNLSNSNQVENTIFLQGEGTESAQQAKIDILKEYTTKIEIQNKHISFGDLQPPGHSKKKLFTPNKDIPLSTPDQSESLQQGFIGQLDQRDLLILENEPWQNNRQQSQSIKWKPPARRASRQKVSVQQFKQQSEAIFEIVSNHPMTGLKEITSELTNRYQICMTKSTVHKRLLGQLGLQHKPIEILSRPIFLRNDHQTLLCRRSFLESIRCLDIQQFYVCGIARFPGFWVSQYGWVPKKVSSPQMGPFLKKIAATQDSISLLVTLNASGLINFETFCGEFTVGSLKTHLKKSLLSEAIQHERRTILISESIGIELSKINRGHFPTKLEEPTRISANDGNQSFESVLAKALSDCRIEYHKIPQFSPQLDPTAQFFRQVQKKFKAYKILNRKLKSRDDLQESMNYVIKCIRGDEYPKFFSSLRAFAAMKQLKGGSSQ